MVFIAGVTFYSGEYNVYFIMDFGK